jgi:hypothetical protein
MNFKIIIASLFSATFVALSADNPPQGVFNPIGLDGKWKSGAMNFTTAAYREEAFKLVLQEANLVANELGLNEKLPITKSDLTEAFIPPFGFAWVEKSPGNVTTSNYCYCVSISNKFCHLIKTDLEKDLLKYQEDYMWPKKQMNKPKAYQLATQWLTAAHMDVTALNRDLHLIIKAEDDYIVAPRGKFVPVYDVGWCKPWQPIPGIIEESHGKWDSVVSVQLFTPTKTLLQMNVKDAKYILRPPLVFTNLAELLSTNAVTGTNAPRSQ